MIKRYGKEEGSKLFNEYCEKQKINGCTEDYFVSKYGEIGKSIYQELNAKKRVTLENLINKYGEIEGTKRFFDFKANKVHTFYSKVSFNLFTELTKYKTDDEMKHIYFGENEFGLYDKTTKKYFKYDYTDTIKKLIIEFNGEKFHPHLEHDDSFKNPYDPTLTSDIVWKNDRQKQACAELNGYTIYYIWETEYFKNKEKIIQQYLQII